MISTKLTPELRPARACDRQPSIYNAGMVRGLDLPGLLQGFRNTLTPTVCQDPAGGNNSPVRSGGPRSKKNVGTDGPPGPEERRRTWARRG